MRNKHFLHVLAGLLLLPTLSHAQFDEVGTFIGISNYSGDLTDRALEPLEFNLSVGLFMRYHYQKKWSLKAQFTRGEISGNDANTALERNIWQRNLRFHSEVYELAALVEYKFYEVKSGYYQCAPYLFAGMAGFYFNPQTEMDGKTYNLHTHQTEGKNYGLVQPAIPFGGGVQLNLNNKGSIGLEIGFRKTFTDYLDDVSHSYPENIDRLVETNALAAQLSYRTPEILSNAQAAPAPGSGRGNPKSKDWYLFFGLTLAVNLKE